jgi:hypothetical protein
LHCLIAILEGFHRFSEKVILVDSFSCDRPNMTRAPAAENSRLRETRSSELPFHVRIATVPP